MPAAKKAKAITLSLSTAIFVMAGLTGCGTSRDAGNVQTKSVRHETKGINRYGVETNGLDGIRARNYRAHNVTSLKTSDELAKHIADMKEVKSANVLLTDRNAYVAVRLTDGHAGKLNTNSYRARSYSGYADNTMRSRSLSPDMGGLRVNDGAGTRSPYSVDRVTPGLNTGTATDRSHLSNDRGLYGTMGTGTYGMMRGLTGSDRIPINENTGDYGVKRENRVNSSDDNTPAEIKGKIAARVKQFAPNVENVYVSSNPEFVEHAEKYSTDLRSGKPVSGMLDTFSSMVERIFPTNAMNHHRDGVLDRGVTERSNGRMNDLR